MHARVSTYYQLEKLEGCMKLCIDDRVIYSTKYNGKVHSRVKNYVYTFLVQTTFNLYSV